MGGFRALNNDEIIAVSGGYFGGGTPIPGSEDEYGKGIHPFSLEARLLSWGLLPYGQNVDTDGDGGADTIVVTATLDQMRSAGILSGSGAVIANSTMNGHSITCQLAQSAQLAGTVVAGASAIVLIGGFATPLAPATTVAATVVGLSAAAVAGVGAATAIVARC